MIWSHTYTVTADPGVIQKGYEYQEKKLPANFRNLIMPKVEEEKIGRRQTVALKLDPNGSIETPSTIEVKDIM